MKKFTVLLAFLVLFCGIHLKAAEQVVNALKPSVDSGKMPGYVIVIATSDSVLSVDAIGWSDIEAKKPMEENTVFWIASMTKSLVGACAMMMVEEGKLDLDAPISDVLPELAHLKVFTYDEEMPTKNAGLGNITGFHDPKSPPTLRQCLCHTAGWRFISPYQNRWGIDSLDHQKSLTVDALMGLNWDPGTRYCYSNVGINVAAAAVERVSGMPIEKMMQERIFDPLEMKESTFWPNQDQISRLAVTYGWNPKEERLSRFNRIPFIGYPLDDKTARTVEGAGGLFTTALDFVKFYQMLSAGGVYNGIKILSPESVKMMTTKQTEEGIEDNYGLGIGLSEDGFGHGGIEGTEAFAFKNGMVCLYFVQILDIPEADHFHELYHESALDFWNHR